VCEYVCTYACARVCVCVCVILCAYVRVLGGEMCLFLYSVSQQAYCDPLLGRKTESMNCSFIKFSLNPIEKITVLNIFSL